MKVFISIPMQEPKMRIKVSEAEHVLFRDGHCAVNPFLDIERKEEPAEDIANCIKGAVMCDAVVLLGDWHNDKCCQLVHRAAELYGKEIYYSLESIHRHGSI